jgi:large repetitive protein
VGYTLYCWLGVWDTSVTSYVFRWERANDAAFTAGVATIAGATSSQYTLAAADSGKYVRCQVTAGN